MDPLACRDPARGEHLAAYEFGLLGPEQQEAFESHLEGCPYCANELFEMSPYAHEVRARPRELIEALSLAPNDPEVRPAASEPSVPSPLPSGRPVSRRINPVWALTSGLGLAAALLLVFLIPRTSPVTDLADLTPLTYVPLDTRGAEAGGTIHSFEKGMEMYTAGRFDEASDLLEASVSAAEADPSIRLPALATVYLAVAQLQSNQVEDAVSILEPAVGSSIPAVSERARWYLAQAHLLRARPDAARRELQALVSSPVYGEAASAQLESLEKSE